MEQAESPTRSGAGQGLIFALVLWLMMVVSVIYFFKTEYRVPPLASDRGSLDTLFYVILAITGVAYVVVQFLIGYYVWRYRDRRGAKSSYWHESHRLEVSWTLATAAILISVVFAGLTLWNRVYSAPPADAFVVEVVGAQFQWDMHYPGADGVFGRVKPELISVDNLLGLDKSDPAAADDIIRTNQLVLPVNRPALIRLRSKDMQHSFFLPNFRVKQDLLPGMTTEAWFVPTKVGEYEIACAELCGLGHYRMRGLLQVMEPADVDRWLAEQAAQ
jgi:cytochrome c oxidase subunit 2